MPFDAYAEYNPQPARPGAGALATDIARFNEETRRLVDLQADMARCIQRVARATDRLTTSMGELCSTLREAKQQFQAVI